jgi:hypothetical protein
MPEGGIPIYILFRTYPGILVCTYALIALIEENYSSEGFVGIG